MPAPESEMTDNDLTLEDFRYRLEHGGSITELSELEAIIAAAYAKGREEVDQVLERIGDITEATLIRGDFVYGLGQIATEVEKARSRIKDQDHE